MVVRGQQLLLNQGRVSVSLDGKNDANCELSTSRKSRASEFGVGRVVAALISHETEATSRRNLQSEIVR
jgi:hypothetical protein